MQKRKRIAVCSVLILAAAGVLLAVFSLIGIFRPINDDDPGISDRVEISPERGIPVYSRKSLVTSAEEYYYAVFTLGNSPKGCLVRADKDYAELFEPESGRAQTLIFSRGTVKKFGVPQEMKSIYRDIGGYILNNIGECDFEYGTYVDLTARKRYIITLIAGTVCAAAGISLAALFRKFGKTKRREEEKCKNEKG